MDGDPHNGFLAHATVGAKEKGAYFTPDPVVRSLLSWATQSPDDQLLDPACGDGRFIAGHTNSVGVERDLAATEIAKRRVACPTEVLHRKSECPAVVRVGAHAATNRA